MISVRDGKILTLHPAILTIRIVRDVIVIEASLMIIHAKFNAHLNKIGLIHEF